MDDILCGVGGLPAPSRQDWRVIRSIRSVACTPGVNGSYVSEEQFVADSAKAMGLVRSLSFYGFLNDRLVSGARKTAEEGVRRILVSNKCLFNFGGSDPEPAVYWIFRTLLTGVMGDLKDFDFGVEILSGCDFWAVDIACRCGLSFAVMDFPDGFSRTRMAALTARACMMSAGRERPALLAKMEGRGDLANAAGLDGVVMERSVGMAPLVRFGMWSMLYDGRKRMMVKEDGK